MGANTKYKDSMFSLLFSDPDILRNLYAALKGISLPADVPVTINTLQDVLFMDRVNDISFEIGGKLVVLIEHQSTINPNMALRLLLYIARVYEKIIGDKNIYASKLIPIPRPEFYVLYNGKTPYPDNATLKLSDAFESGTELGLPEKGVPALELEVTVLNITMGRNEEIVKRCETLAAYSAFVGKVEEYEKGEAGREESIKKAIKYCIEHDILRDFLNENSSEVMNMLMTEWNWDDALAVRFEEGLEEGREQGREQGLEQGREESLEEVAKNALAQGLPVDVIKTITGLDAEIIKNL
jgi:hypothetical protein